MPDLLPRLRNWASWWPSALRGRPAALMLLGGALLCTATVAATMHGRRPHATALRSRLVAPVSPSHTPTAVPSATASPSDTASPTPPAPSPTPTASPTASSSVTRTRTPSPTLTGTATTRPSATPSRTPTSSPTATRSPTATPTATVDPIYYAQDSLEGTGPGAPGPLSGLPTRPDWAARRPVAVVIDNYAPDARPQTGLNRASLVFEAVAEGGITRLMAVYLERDAPVVGPVRSARIYFNAWADGLHALYAHAGGNSDALYQLTRIHALADLDDLKLPAAGAAQPYWRSPDRAAPHNLYTATAPLRGYGLAAGYSPGATSVALPHRVPDPYWHRPNGAWISIAFSSPSYTVRYTYDRTSNVYFRSVGDQAQADPLSRRPVAPSNVVVLYTTLTPYHDAFAPEAVDVHTVGTGHALYFRDGHLVEGTWRKRSVEAPLELLDRAGKPQQFNPGQTWVEVAAGSASVTWHAP